MKTVVQPYDEEVDVTVLEVDMPEPDCWNRNRIPPEVDAGGLGKGQADLHGFYAELYQPPGTAGGAMAGWKAAGISAGGTFGRDP